MEGGLEEPKTVFVTNINYDASESDLKRTLSRYGTVVSVRFSQKKKGIALVEFDSSDAIRNIITFPFVSLRRKRIFFHECHPDRTPTFTWNGLFIKNVPHDLNEEEVSSLFLPFKVIKTLIVPSSHKGIYNLVIELESEGHALEAQLAYPTIVLRGKEYFVQQGRVPHNGVFKSWKDLVSPEEYSAFYQRCLRQKSAHEEENSVKLDYNPDFEYEPPRYFDHKFLHKRSSHKHSKKNYHATYITETFSAMKEHLNMMNKRAIQDTIHQALLFSNFEED